MGEYRRLTEELRQGLDSLGDHPEPEEIARLQELERERLSFGITSASRAGDGNLVAELSDRRGELKTPEPDRLWIIPPELEDGPVGHEERDALLHPEPPRPELRTPSDLLEAARDAEAAGDHKRAEALLGRARMDAPPRTRELYSRHRDLNPVATDEEINAERAARGAPPLNESELDRRIRLTQAVSFTNRGRIKESHAAGLAIKDIRERVAAGEITKEEGERLIAQNLHDREERLRIAREKGVARYAENAQALARSGRALGFGITAIAAQLVMIIAIVLVGFVLLQLFGAFSF